MAVDKPYSDIPGTTIFDTDQARVGYWLNQFAMSLRRAENRDRFLADERAYLDEWQMTEEQKRGVLDRDFNRLISLGGNIYYLAKIGGTDGWNFARIVSTMTEHSPEEHVAMMVAGGRTPDGNRFQHEWDEHGPQARGDQDRP